MTKPQSSRRSPDLFASAMSLHTSQPWFTSRFSLPRLVSIGIHAALIGMALLPSRSDSTYAELKEIDMTKPEFLAKLEYFSMVHGVTRRAIMTLEDKDLDFRPQAKMRTPRELVFHIYAQEKIIAEAIRQRQFTQDAAALSSPETESVSGEVKTLVTARDVLAYADTCHQAAMSILQSLSEEDLNRSVESPFGAYPGWRYFDFAYDEHWHHRGQLYAYLRLLGKEPPMLYDF